MPFFARIACALLAVAVSGPGFAQTPVSEEFSPKLLETLRWLHADVDAALVARNFALPKSQEQVFPSEPVDDPLAQFLRMYAAGRWLIQPTLKAAYEGLVGRQIEFAMLAGREFFPISAFGFCGYAGCHVVRFAEPLGDEAEPFAAALRKDAAEVATIAGRDVAIFNWTFGKEPYLKDRPWECMLVVLPSGDDRELIIATQRVLLEEVHERRNRSDAPAEIPPNVAQWLPVDLTAGVWASLAGPTDEVGKLVTFEYHIGDDSRFILRAPPEVLPDVDPATIDPYEEGADYGPPLATLRHLWKSGVPYELERPRGESVSLTVSWPRNDPAAAARDRITLIFSTAALFQYCIEP